MSSDGAVLTIIGYVIFMVVLYAIGWVIGEATEALREIRDELRRINK